ncbi:hypothetical protein H4R26_005487, partial [Coemansia thaxteri]
MLDIFERNVLIIVWEYQGENIISFLLKHQHVPPGPTEVCNDAAGYKKAKKSLGTQTEDLESILLARQQRQTIDKLIGDLVPGLLNALGAMPQRGELAEAILKQEQMVQQACKLGELEFAKDAAETELQSLACRAEGVDRELSYLLCAIDNDSIASEHTGEHGRLAVLVESLNAVKETCAVDHALAQLAMKKLVALDAALADMKAESKVNVKIVNDASMQTEFLVQVVSRNDSMFTELVETQVATPAHHVDFKQEEDNCSSCSSSSVSTDEADLCCNDDRCSLRSLGSLQMFATNNDIAS